MVYGNVIKIYISEKCVMQKEYRLSSRDILAKIWRRKLKIHFSYFSSLFLAHTALFFISCVFGFNTIKAVNIFFWFFNSIALNWQCIQSVLLVTRCTNFCTIVFGIFFEFIALIQMGSWSSLVPFKWMHLREFFGSHSLMVSIIRGSGRGLETLQIKLFLTWQGRGVGW